MLTHIEDKWVTIRPICIIPKTAESWRFEKCIHTLLVIRWRQACLKNPCFLKINAASSSPSVNVSLDFICFERIPRLADSHVYSNRSDDRRRCAFDGVFISLGRYLIAQAFFILFCELKRKTVKYRMRLANPTMTVESLSILSLSFATNFSSFPHPRLHCRICPC